MQTQTGNFVRAASLADVRKNGRLAVRVGERVLALFLVDGEVYAVDNRCPHMGFPWREGASRTVS